MALHSCQDTGDSQPSQLQSEGPPLAFGPAMGLNCHSWDNVSDPPEPKAPAGYTCGPGAVCIVWTAGRVAVGIHLCPVAVLRDIPRHLCVAGKEKPFPSSEINTPSGRGLVCGVCPC